MNLRSTHERQESAAEHVRRARANLRKALADLRDEDGELAGAGLVELHLEGLETLESGLRAQGGAK